METRLVPAGLACSRCIGGQFLAHDVDNIRVCLQCGHREYTTEPLPYIAFNEVGYRGGRHKEEVYA